MRGNITTNNQKHVYMSIIGTVVERNFLKENPKRRIFQDLPIRKVRIKNNSPRDFMTSFNSEMSMVPSPFASNISKATLNFAFSSFVN